MSRLKSSKKAIAFVLTLVLVLGVGIPQNSFGAAGDSIEFTAAVDKDTVEVGENFNYTIQYSYSSLNNNFLNEEILFSLPETLEFVDFIESDHVKSFTREGSLPGSSEPGIKIIMNDIIEGGSTGVLKVTARFKPGSITTTTSITGILTNNPNASVSAIASVPAVTATINPNWTWTLDKTKHLPRGEITPARGGETTYKILVEGNDLVGGFPIKKIVVTDTLPPGSVFVTATGICTTSPSGTSPTSLEWTIPLLSPGAVVPFYVTVRYPEDYPSTATAINRVDIIGESPVNSETATLAAIVTHGVIEAGPAVGKISKSSRQTDDRYSVGQEVVFYINGYNNTGNIAIDRMEIVDEIPDGLGLNSVTKGNTDEVWYSTFSSPGSFTQWVDPSTKPALAPGEYIKWVKWVKEDAPVGFVGQRITIKGTLLEKYREGSLSGTAVTTGNSITNTATLTATKGATNLTGSAASVTIKVGTSGEMKLPWLELTKFADTPPKVNKKVRKGDTVTYTIRLKNNDFATGDLELSGVDSIIIRDIPDASVMTDYKFLTMSGIYDKDGSIKSGAVLGSISGSGLTNGSSGAAVTSVAWEWTGGTLEPGDYIDITYSTKVLDNAWVGAYSNTATATTSGVDIDDRSTKLSASALVLVRFSGSLNSSKGIQGPNDTQFIFSTQSAIASTETVPGGTIRYQIKVNNENANGPIKNVVMIDKFPYFGDKGVVLSNTGRGSQWAPYLVNKVTGIGGSPLPSGVAVYYSTSTNPDISKLSKPLGAHDESKWLSVLPSDMSITEIKAIKIDFGNNVFYPSEEAIYVEWDMRVPTDLNTTYAGLVANNSFAFGATYIDYDLSGNAIDVPFIQSEPRMVSATLTGAAVGEFAIGDFIWEDMNKNGKQDVSEAGINGISVYLYKAGETSYSAFTVTDYNLKGEPGYYKFPGLSNGAYTVEFVMPEGYFITDHKKTTDGGLDSDFQLTGKAIDRKYIASVNLNSRIGVSKDTFQEVIMLFVL